MANMSDFRVRGQRVAAPFQAELRYVTPGYFDALGIPITRGRAFTDADNRDAPPVIAVNETLAKKVLGDRDPIGASTTRGTIVGIVGDVRQANLDREASPEIYYPLAQNYSEIVDVGMTLVVRGSGDPDSLVAPVRDIIRRVSPNQAIFNAKSMQQVLDDSMADFAMYLWLMVGFAVLALMLAGVGTYGVMAYVTGSRMREFAVRVALGANRGTLTGLVLRDGVKLTGIGIAVGAAATLAETPLLRAMPVTIHPPSPIVLGAVAVLVATAALLASLLPALRASAADPMDALRQE
jgi:ABC-type antimicrobial peptide transport system permease subunit